MSKDRIRLLLACVATLAIVLPLGYLWQQSRMPSTLLRHGHGVPRLRRRLRTGPALPGGQSMAAMHADAATRGTRSVKDLTVGTDRPADKVVNLEARKGTVRLASGRTVDGYTLNGSSPGPLIEVTQGELLEVHLRNENVPGRHHAALARAGRPERRGRRGRRDAGRRAARRGAHLPVRRRAGRHVLVPLPPGVARAGDRRPAGATRGPAREAARPAGGRGGAGTHLRRGRAPSTARASSPSSPGRASRSGCAS